MNTVFYIISELYDVSVEYFETGSAYSRFKVLFKNKDTDVESDVSGSLDVSQPNKIRLTCVVDGTMYKSDIAFIENSIYLFNKVLL